MKVIVSKNDLRDAINGVMPAVAVKPSTPILAGIHFSAQNSALTARATNFSLDITAKIPANVEVAGDTVTAGKFLQPIVNKLSGEIVTLTAGDSLTVKSEAASFNLLTDNPDYFPPPAADEPTSSFRIHGAALKKLITQTVFAAASDPSRPAFQAVQFATAGTNITATATNAHRIAISSDSIFDQNSTTTLVPASTLKAIAPALSNQVVQIDTFSSAIAFTFDNLRFVSRLVDGALPDITRIIPASTATTATLNAGELRSALERIQIIAKENDYHTVAFNFTADGLEISSDEQSIGRAFEHVDAEVSGSAINIAFNFAYILDALKAAGANSISLGFNSALQPATFRNTDDQNFLYIITPLKTK